MKKFVVSLVAIMICSCVSLSKYNQLESAYSDLENELETIRNEKEQIEETLAEHDISIEELEDKLSAFEERMSRTKETIITAKGCVEEALFWLHSGNVQIADNLASNAYSFLSYELLILEDNGY